MDPDNLVIRLIIKGTQAEFAGRRDEARALYWQAWEAAQNDLEACISAHYVARHQSRDEDALYWNQLALDFADAVGDASVESFYPSLYVNLGRSYELLGQSAEANHYYHLAAELGLVHQDG